MSNVGKPRTAAEIQQDWDTNPRWKGITRDYTAAQVEELQGSVVEEHTLARRGSEILWDAVTKGDGSYINALGALMVLLNVLVVVVVMGRHLKLIMKK